MNIAVTGHRPQKLGGYDEKTWDKLVMFAAYTLSTLKPSYVYTGMALGWDQAVAQAAVDLDIPFCAAIPFCGQEMKWTNYAQEYYMKLLNQAAHIEVVCRDGYHPAKMQIRNEWMVDQLEHAQDKLVALWDGSPGGTANCVRYAERKWDMPAIKTNRILNAWDEWRKF